MTGYEYLAAPYSSGEPAGITGPMQRIRLRAWRLDKMKFAIALLMTQGRNAISPVMMSNQVADILGGHGWDTWKAVDLALVAAADRVLILPLQGWEESAGVTAEIEHAREMDVPVTVLDDAFMIELETYTELVR